MVMLFILILLFPVTAHAITAEELREMSDVWEAGERERAERIETKDLKKLIPKAPEKKKGIVEIEQPGKTIVNKLPLKKQPKKDPGKKQVEKQVTREVTKEVPVILQEEVRPKALKPRIEKYRMNAEQAGSPLDDHSFLEVPEAEAALFPVVSTPWGSKSPEGLYFPPPRQGGFGALTDAVSPDKTRKFGIRIGTWIAGELKRAATNAEPGLIEIYTSEDISGKKRTLPSGTILFAHKAYNSGTQKLDLLAEKGITPNGIEFEIKGLVFDLQKSAGLLGTITTDSEMIAERSAALGVLAAGGEAVRHIAGTTVVGAASSAAAQSLIGDSSDAVQETKKLKQTIRSSPQKLLIRVEETF